MKDNGNHDWLKIRMDKIDLCISAIIILLSQIEYKPLHVNIGSHGLNLLELPPQLTNYNNV